MARSRWGAVSAAVTLELDARCGGGAWEWLTRSREYLAVGRGRGENELIEVGAFSPPSHPSCPFASRLPQRCSWPSEKEESKHHGTAPDIEAPAVLARLKLGVSEDPALGPAGCTLCSALRHAPAATPSPTPPLQQATSRATNQAPGPNPRPCTPRKAKAAARAIMVVMLLIKLVEDPARRCNDRQVFPFLLFIPLRPSVLFLCCSFASLLQPSPSSPSTLSFLSVLTASETLCLLSFFSSAEQDPRHPFFRFDLFGAPVVHFLTRRHITSFILWINIIVYFSRLFRQHVVLEVVPRGFCPFRLSRNRQPRCEPSSSRPSSSCTSS